jgi:hypothetical protein
VFDVYTYYHDGVYTSQDYVIGDEWVAETKLWVHTYVLVAMDDRCEKSSQLPPSPFYVPLPMLGGLWEAKSASRAAAQRAGGRVWRVANSGKQLQTVAKCCKVL